MTQKDRARMWIRDAVFGVQDGLLSTMGALTGIAAGTQDRTVVLISGLVIIAVESLSMAAGSYVSSKSHREYLERLLKEEQETIVRNPEGERRELHAMYRERGYSDPEIAIVERRLFSSPELLLEDMAHKELGICPRTFEEPAGNALVMGSSYVAGGLIPVLPYTFLSLTMAVAVSISVTFAALFALGGWKGRLVRRGIWRSGLEMVGMAGLAALAGYGIGRLAKGWL